MASRDWHLKLVIVMVGLPARGKSYIAKKLTTYHSWLGLQAKFFNVGDHRREVMKGTAQTADFFASANQNASSAREVIASEVLDCLLEWLAAGGDVAVFDATNTTKNRRRAILERCKVFSEKLNVIFVESICSDPMVIRKNMIQKAQGSPDYREMPLEKALEDLQSRIGNYERVYETIDDDSFSYIKLINLQSKVICNRIFGSIAQATASYLMALNVSDRVIWVCRAGQVEGVEDFNNLKVPTKADADTSKSPPNVILKKQLTKGSILTRSQTSDGFNMPGLSEKNYSLSEKGLVFARKLHDFIEDKTDGKDCEVYTSTFLRAIQTAKFFKGRTQNWSSLNMLDTGVLNGMSIFEIRNQFPEEYEAFINDPFHFRLPGGESVEDLVHRVEPFIVELERQTEPCLVISHLSTLRVIMAYFLGIPISQFSSIDIPQHTVLQLEPSQYGWKETRFSLLGDDE